MNKTFLLFLLLLIPFTASADVVTGKVVDAETRQPLQGVEITIEFKKGSSTIKNVLSTDSAGSFRSNVYYESRILLQFKLIGYNPARKVDYSFGSNKDT